MNLLYFFRRIIPLLLGITAVCDIHATTYYVSGTTGSDSNNGTSLASPFQTIQKAANMMLSSGDVCNIRAGLYRETVTVKASNITFQAYNPTPATPSTAEPVTITGTELIPAANWAVDSTGTSGTTWSVAVPSGNGTVTVDQTQVFQGTLQTSGSQTGMVMKPEACWPNAGPTYPWHDSTLAHPSPYNQVGDWSYVDTSSTSGGYFTFTDAQLPSSYSSFLAGAMINIMPFQGWTLAFPTPTVTSFDGTTVLTNDPTSSSSIIPGNEYYLFGKKQLMDSQGEWFCSGSGTTPVTIYFLGTSTQPQNVEVKRRLYGFDLSGRSSITLTSLNFFGCTINTDASSTSCNFNWLMMKYLQHNRQVYNGNVYSLTLYNNSTLRNCELAWASTSMLCIAGNNIKVINNYLHDSGYVPQGVAMVIFSGSGNLVSHNTFQNSGHAIMGGSGVAAVIEYNNMSNAMKMCSDGGVFYSGGVGGNTVFRYNLLHDSPGPAGHGGNGVAGFYLDNYNADWVVHHNIIWNLTGQQSHAIQINGRTNFNMIFNNTCWNCYSGSLYTAAYTDGPTGSNIYNNIFQGGPGGVQQIWNQSDLRYNYNANVDPGFINAAGGNFQLSSTATSLLNMGTPIPGVTDVAPCIAITPDIGAMEYGGTNWATTTGLNCVGYNFTAPPSPDPVYVYNSPVMPFVNMVQDPSFESGTLAAYSGTGNLGLIRSDSWVDDHLRSGLFGVQFAGGTSQLSQTVTNLQSDSRYVFQCGVLKTDTTATVTLGVTSVPYPTWEVTVLPSGTVTGLWDNVLPSVATMYAVPFSTGPSSTQATVYVKVTRDAGALVAAAVAPNLFLSTTAAPLTSLSNGTNNWNYFGNAYPATGVYVDDFSVILDQGNSDPQPYAMPIVDYPFNETSGTTAHDSTTRGSRDATFHNSAAFRTGQTGYGYSLAPSLTGSGKGYANAPASLAMPTTGSSSYTVAFWLLINGNTPTQWIASQTNGAQGWWVQINGSPSGGVYSLTLGARGSSDSSNYSYNISVPAATWTHLAFTIDRVNGKVMGYINGVGQNPSTLTFGSFGSLGQLTLGSTTTNTSNWQMDDFQAWNYALSNPEFAAAASRDTSMALRLKFNDASGSTQAWDATGQGNNGTLSGFNSSTCWIDNSLHFTTGTVQCPSTLVVPATGTSSFTVAYWLLINSNTAKPLLAAKTSGSTGWWFQLNGAPSSGQYSMALNARGVADSGTSTYSTTVPAGTWTHFAYTIDRVAGTVTTYINGVSQGSTTVTFGDLGVANAVSLGSGTSDWQMADFRLYTRALTSNEVQFLPQQIASPPYSYTESPDTISAYNLWLLANGLPLGTSMTGSVANDGITNLMKCALGISAYTSGYQGHLTFGSVAASGSNYLTLTYICPSPALSGISYIVETSPDLSPGSWTTASLVQVSNTTTAGYTTITVRNSTPITGGNKSFMRLKITQP